MEKRPWWPKMTTYPTLVLDDHATEWASRIEEDQHRIEVGGEEMEVGAPPGLSSENVSEIVANRPLEPNYPYARTPEVYVPDRVWSGDVSSGLC